MTNLLRQLLTDCNSLEINKVCHLLVVSNTTVFAFIDANAAYKHQLPLKLCETYQ